jgi:hypothetical protein
VLPQPLRQSVGLPQQFPQAALRAAAEVPAVCQTFGPENPLFWPKRGDFQFGKPNFVIISAPKLDL